jgi:aminoglycoside phosphotransferase (APT) family kinase protein
MTADNPFLYYQAKVEDYLKEQNWNDVPVMARRDFSVIPLAKGEYNLNYLLKNDDITLVFRVNMASQIGKTDQIVYEYKALKLLQHSGVTPVPFFVDNSRKFIDRGISIMQYLQGEPLDYRKDLDAAAHIFSVIHQIKIPSERNHLIVEQQPLSLIYDECMKLLRTYFFSKINKPDIRTFLLEVADWAQTYKEKEDYFLADPYFCIVNTEVNSGNFIVHRENGTAHLIDWEMPRWGDPSTDLCHFCSPLTTLWKSDFQFDKAGIEAFINNYKKRLNDTHLQSTLEDRVRLKMPFVYLRGISWSAMAWINYQNNSQKICNKDTWCKLNQYMNLSFIQSLFLPFMNN